MQRSVGGAEEQHMSKTTISVIEIKGKLIHGLVEVSDLGQLNGQPSEDDAIGPACRRKAWL